MADPIVFFQPTVTGDTNAYATGDNVGGKLTISDAVALDRPWGMIRSVVLVSDTVLTVPFDVFFFAANPSASTFTNNSAQSIHADDRAKVIGVAHCSDVSADGGVSVHQAQGVMIPFRATTAGTIYAGIVVRGAPTLAANGDIVLTVGIQQEGA